MAPVDLEDERAIESALYLSDEYNLTPDLSLYGDIRFSFFFDNSLRSSPGEPANVSFLAPDSKGHYDIVVKALDNNGRIGEERFTILIK